MIRFITGTDTGVGKTVAAAVLAYRARSDGVPAHYLKPVQTGVAPGEPGDADFVAAAAGIEAGELIRFSEPLAPAVAAERAGSPIDFDELVREIKACDRDVLFVEGAGGLLAPLTLDETMADLAIALGGDVVVATRPGLGTLNHTALTLEAARSHGLNVAGLVVSGWPTRPGLAERTNLDRLAAMAPLLAIVRRLRGLSVDEGRSGVLREALERGTAIV